MKQIRDRIEYKMLWARHYQQLYLDKLCSKAYYQHHAQPHVEQARFYNQNLVKYQRLQKLAEGDDAT